MTSEASEHPTQIWVFDSSPPDIQSQPYGVWDIPPVLRKLDPEAFWRVIIANVEAMTHHMESMDVPISRMRWEVMISLLTYDEIYESQIRERND